MLKNTTPLSACVRRGGSSGLSSVPGNYFRAGFGFALVTNQRGVETPDINYKVWISLILNTIPLGFRISENIKKSNRLFRKWSVANA